MGNLYRSVCLLLSPTILSGCEYVYAGKEEDALEFFDKEYTPGDKEELKAEIRSRLDECAVYKAIYRR